MNDPHHAISGQLADDQTLATFAGGGLRVFNIKTTLGTSFIVAKTLEEAIAKANGTLNTNASEKR